MKKYSSKTMRDKIIVTDPNNPEEEVTADQLRVWLDRERDYITRLDKIQILKLIKTLESK